MAAAQREKRITVLISGSGTNLQALLDASLTTRLPARITHVLSSRSTAYGLERARKHSPNPPSTSYCALKTFQTRNPGATRQDYDAEIARAVLETKPDLVVFAGWMHILSEVFLDILAGTKAPPAKPALPPPAEGSKDEQEEQAEEVKHPLVFPIPVINLHPALPGAFDGAHAIERAFQAFQEGKIQHTGVMIHRVVKEVDAGEPLVVREVEIEKEDTLEDLENRIHEVEHEIIVDGARVVLEQLDREAAAIAEKDKDAAIVENNTISSEQGAAKRKATPINPDVVGRPLVICGPSGTGKSTLLKRLHEVDHPGKFGFSVSHTTRQPRISKEGVKEVDGVDYHFVDRDEFKRRVADGEFLESAEFSGNCYGTTIAALAALHPRRCILDIDTQGVQILKKKASTLQPPLKPVYLFLAPPSIAELCKRLTGRGTESPESLQARLNAAVGEIKYAMEGNHDVVIVNDDVERAYELFEAVAMGLAGEGFKGDQLPDFGVELEAGAADVKA